MARITVTCRDCGDIDLGVDDIVMRLCIETDEAEYRFTCAKCAKITVKQASERTFEILASAGVHYDEWHLPAELIETRDGQVISHNDILDFHNLMAEDDAFAQAVAELDGS